MTMSLCRGICDNITKRKRLTTPGRPLRHRYVDGGRYCQRCDKFYTKDITETFYKKILCPCCHVKTRGRPRDCNKRLVAEEILVVSH